MVTATLQVCPEPGRRPTRTLPYWATAPLLGCFPACLTESFLAVIQAHRPQVWVGGDGGPCLPLRAGGSAARWSTTRFWQQTHLVSNPRSTLPMWPWAGRPITGPLCWVPDPAAPSGPTRGVFCTGCCVAGSEDSHLPELTRPLTLSFLGTRRGRGHCGSRCLSETPPGPHSTWVWLSRCSQSSAAPGPHTPGAAPAPRPFLAWPGLCRAFLQQPLGGQEDGVCCGAGTRQPHKQWARQGPREAPKAGQVSNLRGLVCPSSMGVRQTLPAPQRGLDMAGVGVGWQLPSRGSAARPGVPPGGGTQGGAVRLHGHLGRKPQLCIPLLWPQLLSRWEAANRQKGKEERETGPGVHTQTCAHTRVHKHEHAAWGLVALLGRPP